jgi:hypothetical protein
MGSRHSDWTAAPAGCLLKLLLGLFPLAALLGLTTMIRLYGLGWGPQHQVSEPAAQLGTHVSAAVAEQGADVQDLDDAERGALRITASLLHFGFRHRTQLRFDRPRQGNCLEYAELFGVVFNQLAEGAKLTAHAEVVHSEPTSFMGFAPSHPAFRSHDWVVISDGDYKRYVDPTLHDAWLGADISRNVEGSLVAVPRGRAAPRPVRRPERIESSLPPPGRPRGLAGILDRVGVPLPSPR